MPPPLPPKVTEFVYKRTWLYLYILWHVLEIPICFYYSDSLQPSQARSSSVSDEFALSEGCQTVRRLPGSDNGPVPVTRRQSTPERGSKAEHTNSDYLSVSISSPGLLSHTADHGKTHTNTSLHHILQIMFTHCLCTTLI